ncbi:hypothetical protein GWI33_018988 [Rhynchophorus ferrugineus]|uniref:Uncharacterized protein n=1 Tax=Rhynchophorus ferrugineus TaxID=354439 RepID=A0A834HUR0_RHYFE|nr:hypothetical protein GWI33_018988 [Rhynchophorus ferrugineus]
MPAVFFCFRMQQQQLAAQLAHHGGDRRPPLSPAPSDSDSDISLGAHSPVGSPTPLRLGPQSPNPMTSFRFGAHSPGPMPAQFRFGGTHTPPSYKLDRQSTTPPNFRLDRGNSKLDVDSPPESASHYSDAVNLRLSGAESPIDVDSHDYEVRDKMSGNSPIRLDRTPPQTTLQHSPPMNLSGMRSSENNKIEAPLALRPQLTTPLQVQVGSHQTRMVAPSPHTHLLGPHGGIVRIAPPSPQAGGPVLHRPYSPARLT